MSNTVLGELLAAIALVVFSVNIILTKVASSRLNLDTGFLISVSVNVVFCLALACVQHLTRGTAPHWNAYGFGLFLVAGLFSTWLGRWFFFEAIVRFGPARASIFQVSSPVFSVAIAWVVLAERLSAPSIVGMALALAGLVVVVYVPGVLSGPRQASEHPALSLPRRLLQSSLCLGLGSSFAYAVGNVLRASAIRSWNEPVIGAFLGALCGAVLHAAFSTSLNELRRSLAGADRTGLALYALSGVLTISAQVCSIASLHYIPVGLSNLITLCSPILVFPLSYWLLANGEGLTLRTAFGSALALGGIGLVVWSRNLTA
jgi:drug/metabolite transporter (DMT)-like permease